MGKSSIKNKNLSKIIAPSIFASDFANLEKSVRKAEKFGCEYLHIDIMDGHFVPNISFGPKIVNDIKKITNLKLDTHLMVENPDFFIEKFYQAGSKIITFHYEIKDDKIKIIKKIKSYNIKAGISIKPATSIDEIIHLLNEIDLVLIMTVEPGFSGQKIIKSAINKIEILNDYRKKNNLDFIIEVDGGINFNNYNELIDSGADLLVMGSAFYSS